MQSNNQQEVPRFVINLDDNPYHRWDEPCKLLKPRVKEVEKHINEMLASNKLMNVAVKSFQTVLSGLTRLNLVAHSKELKGLSHSLGIPLGTLVSMQLIYEISTCCTSVIAKTNASDTLKFQNEDGNSSNNNNESIVLARTMDWSMDYLKQITIEADFHVGGRSLFKSTTWLGYVGILTGVSSNGFAISINYRRSNGGSPWTNAKELLKYSWPVGYLVREALTSSQTFEQACKVLEVNRIIAPCFMTIAGVDKGMVMARNTNSVFRKSILSNNNDNSNNIETPATITKGENIQYCNNNYLVQTNNEEKGDDENNFLWSNERRCFIKENFDTLPLEERTDSRIWELFSNFPVNNEDTIYGTIMKPSEYSIETRIPSRRKGFI